MGLEIGLWRIDDAIQQVEPGDMPSEEQLGALLESSSGFTFSSQS
jgi:hypothetical protein